MNKLDGYELVDENITEAKYFTRKYKKSCIEPDTVFPTLAEKQRLHF